LTRPPSGGIAAVDTRGAATLNGFDVLVANGIATQPVRWDNGLVRGLSFVAGGRVRSATATDGGVAAFPVLGVMTMSNGQIIFFDALTLSLLDQDSTAATLSPRDVLDRHHLARRPEHQQWYRAERPTSRDGERRCLPRADHHGDREEAILVRGGTMRMRSGCELVKFEARNRDGMTRVSTHNAASSWEATAAIEPLFGVARLASAFTVYDGGGMAGSGGAQFILLGKEQVAVGDRVMVFAANQCSPP
jgi:hypothetical protein